MEGEFVLLVLNPGVPSNEIFLKIPVSFIGAFFSSCLFIYSQFPLIYVHIQIGNISLKVYSYYVRLMAALQFYLMIIQCCILMAWIIL